MEQPLVLLPLALAIVSCLLGPLWEAVEVCQNALCLCTTTMILSQFVAVITMLPLVFQARVMVGSLITASVVIYSRTTAHVQAKLYESHDGEQAVEGLKAIREDSKSNSDNSNDSTSDSEATQNESMEFPSSDSDFCQDDAEDGSEDDEDPAWLVAMNSSQLRQTPELYPAVRHHAMMVQEPLSDDELSAGDDEYSTDHEEEFDGDEETSHRRRFRLPAARQAQQVPIAHAPTESVIANNYMREDAVMNLSPYAPRDESDSDNSMNDGLLHEQEGENEMELLLESSIDLRAQHQADHDDDDDEEDIQVVPGSSVIYDPASSSSE